MPTPEGGVEWELAQAEHAMVAAGTDAVALALAQRRHADAIRNMMQGAMVPMFVELVERTLGGKIDGLRTDVQDWASESAARLGKLEARLGALEDRQARHEASTLEGRLNATRRAELTATLEQLEPYLKEILAVAERERRAEADAHGT